MASKKYTALLGLLGLVQSATFAQKNDANADWWKDSSKVATKRLPQYNEFANNQYPYPAKPRDMWELGFHGGYSFISGDIDARPGFGGGLSLRKSLGHIFSVRADYTGSFNYGLDYRTRPADAATAAALGYAVNQQYVANYRNRTHQGNLDFIASLNTLSHYRGNPKTNIYTFVGYSLVVADVDVDNSLTGANLTGVPFGGKRSDIKKALKDKMNGYNSNAPVTNGNREPVGRVNDNQLIRHAVSFGAGISFKLSSRLSLGVEERLTVPFSDDMDGVNAGKSNDFYSYTAIRGGLAIGNSSKRVAPLWWINPNNFIYNELNNPKHMKLPPPVLPDADGDGVTDQFDLEPNTPAGAPVDARGRALDTDGDGVPDYKDKELLTPQKCFPVNADGVGNCPEPECCKELRDKIANLQLVPACSINNLPSLQFKSGSVKISKDGESILNSVAEKLNANPTCKVKIIGYGASDKRAQQLSWDRVNAVEKYLVEKQGISEGRLIFTYGQEGDSNTVDFQGTTEEGPNSVPAPHPNLKRTK
ncbi:OmpA family protein [Filimonas lacunae]|uniref:OmpA family protein n=1 Tax=Filimonas lacunae TaxID=477680 RepID=A0A173MMA8_9BACT|nr:OmpA family protein [Filimonas lacunae]BAV08600.1 OmpA/MotB domain protein [Filimonas lacunae]SIS58148.1 OmpA family protein [Filimonas lacunae]